MRGIEEDYKTNEFMETTASSEENQCECYNDYFIWEVEFMNKIYTNCGIHGHVVFICYYGECNRMGFFSALLDMNVNQRTSMTI